MPLHTAELAILERVRSAGTPEFDALREVCSLSETASEAESLHAILKIGLATIEEKVMNHGYAAMAAERDDEDLAIASMMRQRTLDRAARD